VAGKFFTPVVFMYTPLAVLYITLVITISHYIPYTTNEHQQSQNHSAQ